jgi:peptide/nickel transport system permease protein
MAVVGLFVIFIYAFIAVFAPVIQSATGLDPEAQNPLNRYMKVATSSIASSGEREDKITRFIQEKPDLANQLQTELMSKGFVQSVKPEDALYDLSSKDVADIKTIVKQLDGPGAKEIKELVRDYSTFHLLGTDELGRDVFIRLVYGTRVSMGVGVLVAIVSALIGLLIGALAGYHGGFVDTALMRITDALLSLPQIPILIVIAAVDLDKVPGARTIISASHENILKLVCILVIFSWMTVARLVRASVLSLREREFILAAKTLGATDTTIILRHLLPNVMAPLLVSVTLGVGNSILYEAALSFLGLGIQPPTPSWGNMLNNAQDLISEAPFLAILPGLQILMVVMSFNYLGDGLQDAIDPKAIRR